MLVACLPRCLPQKLPGWTTLNFASSRLVCLQLEPKKGGRRGRVGYEPSRAVGQPLVSLRTCLEDDLPCVCSRRLLRPNPRTEEIYERPHYLVPQAHLVC